MYMTCKEFSPGNRIRNLRGEITIEYNSLSDKEIIFYRDNISGELRTCPPEEFITLSYMWNMKYRVKMIENTDIGMDVFQMRPCLEI